MKSKQTGNIMVLAADGGDPAAGYGIARRKCAAVGIDTDAAIRAALGAPVSIHCWQGDDIRGFETRIGGAGSGLLAAGDAVEPGILGVI